MVAAPAKKITFQDPVLAGLPIPPAESIEEWVSHVNSAMLDRAFSAEQEQAVIAWIRQNPSALRYHKEYLRFEVTMMDFFDGPDLQEQAEPVEEMASPIW